MSIKSVLTVGFIAALSACSVNSSKNHQSDTECEKEVSSVDVRGKWFLDNIVVDDSLYVLPNEEVPSVEQYIVFNDSTYFIHTNCNSFNGSYVINGYSIMLGDGAATEMACDNMATEDILRQVLPHISVIEVVNDSIVSLNSTDESGYIVLRKAVE